MWFLKVIRNDSIYFEFKLQILAFNKKKEDVFNYFEFDNLSFGY